MKGIKQESTKYQLNFPTSDEYDTLSGFIINYIARNIVKNLGKRCILDTKDFMFI